jgi:chromosome segregation ATPase
MKSLTLALCVVAILGSAASTFLYFQIGNAKEVLQQQVSSAEARSTEIQGRLTESTGQNETLQKRLAELDSDLGDAKSKATAAEGRSAQLTRDIAQIRNQLTAKNDAEQALNAEITQLKRDVAQAKLAASSSSPAEIEGYKTTIATLQARVTELEASRSTNNAVAAPVGAPVGTSSEVVSIGDQNAFVVINMGSARGVQVNQRVNITRGADIVAVGVVSSVQPTYSIAQITPGSVRGGLSKGDIAKIAQ